MATAFTSEFKQRPAGLLCVVTFHGADVQVKGVPFDLVVTGVDFVNDNPTQIQAKIATAIRTLSASVRNNTGAAGVTVPANGIVMPGLSKG